MNSRSGLFQKTSQFDSRRSFLQVGSLALGGLTVLQMLQARKAAAETGGRPPKSVILLWMTGGPSHIDTVDMKPEATAEIRGPFQPIETSLPGFQVCDLMPGHARIAKHLAVIRSLTHSYSVHDDAQHLVQTGYPQLNARQAGQRHPCQASVMSHFRRDGKSGLPGYVCVPEDYRTHAGFYQTASFLSARHNALNSGGDPKLGNYRPPEFALPTEVNEARFQDRLQLSQSLDVLRRRVGEMAQFQDDDDIRQQAVELVTGRNARKAFDLSGESESLKDRYGRHAWGQYTLQARRLVEAGVGFVTVNLYEKDVDWWDDHYDIEKNLRKRLPVFDQAFATLIEDLYERGLQDEVLVVACGEFGRAPRIDALAGRAHWPKAMHAVLCGGGITTGQVIGSTTRDGGEPADRPLTPGDLLASIYRVLGINHDTTIPDRQNRPVPLLQQGTIIKELFG